MRRWVDWSLSAWEEVRRNDLALHASALAFWLLLSLVPALAFLFAILKAFRLLEAARPYLLGALAAGQADLAGWITRYVEAAQGATLGGAGILSLLAVGFAALQRVKKALNGIWNVEVRPRYGTRLIEYLAVLALAPFLILLPVMASAALRHPAWEEIAQVLPALLSLRFMAVEYAGYPIYWILLFYAYAFLPDTRVGWRSAALGGIVAGTLLNGGQTIYLRTVFRITDYNLIYGALALLPFLMLWLFLGSVIFLLGAELAYVSQHHAYLVGKRALARQPGPGRAALALRLLVTLMAAFRETAAPVALAGLARRAGVPDSTAQAVAAWLREGGLIAAVEGAPGRFVPARPLEPVTVAEALRRLGALPFFAIPNHGPAREALEPLGLLFREADAVLAARLEQTPLEALLVAARGEATGA
jgi:membrane protein